MWLGSADCKNVSLPKPREALGFAATSGVLRDTDHASARVNGSNGYAR